MSINELPKSTSRLLSSTQVLTTPASLVKELLDNALDAEATSVDIVIATNTIDRIEVHDNGHGICPQDLNVIGKRGHTSKLRDFDELKTLGGRSLGFRGEALSSALELGTVSITTRIDGEAVAMAVKLKGQGGFESQTSTSHPVGTTICVTNIFSCLPVRKQTALKGASKTISLIKAMLHSYALARVNVRLTFKVLKFGQSTWSFAPRAMDGMREVVSQTVGREIATQCVEVISVIPVPAQVNTETRGLGDGTSANLNHHLNSEVPQPEFTIQGFLPKPDADFTKVKGGQYLSIDSRPVSSTRGTPKKIVSLYRKKIAAVLGETLQEHSKTPFIRLNIVCPAGSYDPNVEPAKDDVLFENEELILSIFEKWLGTVYGDRKEAMRFSSGPSTSHKDPSESPRLMTDVEFLRVDGTALSSTASETGISKELNATVSQISVSGLESSSMYGKIPRGKPETQDVLQAPDQSRPGFDMSENFLGNEESDDDDQLHIRDQLSIRNRSVAERTKHKQKSQNQDILNPWVIARLIAPITKTKPSDPHLADFVENSHHNRPSPMPIMLPTPRRSSPLRSSLDNSNVESPDGHSLQNITTVESSQASIEGWLKRNRELSGNSITQLHDDSFPSPEGSNKGNGNAGPVNISISQNTSSQIFQSPSATQDRLRYRTLRNATNPFVPPLQLNRSVIPLTIETRTQSATSRQPRPIGSDLIFNRDASHYADEYEQTSDVYDALDFERRKGTATRKLREKLRLSRSDAEVATNRETRHGGSLPFKNRIDTEAAMLDSEPVSSLSKTLNDRIPPRTSLADDDPRAYLIRRQRSNSASFGEPRMGRRLKRMKTALLPLETIPHNTELHSLCQAVPTNINFVRMALLSLETYDQYVRSGTLEKGLVMPSADIQVIKMQLESLMENLWESTNNDEVAVELDFRELEGRCAIGA